MKKSLILQSLVLIVIAVSCENESKNDLSLEKVSGYVQKGPYLNGTSITISELSTDLTPTGKNFPSQILDNKGTFEIKNINLSSQYVELIADGFYFNEVTNSNSTAQLTLYALSDITNKASLNVNVLSDLEKSRIEYLVTNGIAFSEAKRQAQTEILKIFGVQKADMGESELLDITKAGDENGILLAISVILQGSLTVSELSELIANISTDIREDGVLNSQTLGLILVNNAKALKIDKIRENLENRYESLGETITIPNFEKYVNQFIDSTNYEYTGLIEYPAAGNHGLNILDKEKKQYNAGDYSMIAILPEGTSLKVKISGQNWCFPATQANTGWEYTDYTNSSRVFSSTKTGIIDFAICLENYQDSTWSNQTRIFVFENSSTDTTWTKVITVL